MYGFKPDQDVIELNRLIDRPFASFRSFAKFLVTVSWVFIRSLVMCYVIGIGTSTSPHSTPGAALYVLDNASRHL